MRRGFTLVELLAVMGLMGLMAAMAIGGYSAVVRGMSDRAALDAAKGIADAALQRAMVDGKRTQIYLFDEVLKVDSEMSAGIVNGLAIAVRPVGRISAKIGELLCDEFGDLERAYGTTQSGEEEGSVADTSFNMRLYNIKQEDFAVVKPYVAKAEVDEELLESNAANNGESWTTRAFEAYGFQPDEDSGEGNATFEAGQEYGQEFSVIRLPPGYTFSPNVSMTGAGNLGQHKVKVLTVLPTATVSPGIDVYRRRPDGNFERIGSTSTVKDGE